MANQEHVDILKQGVEVWNRWREEHNDITPDLTKVNLSGAYLLSASLYGANLSGADLRDADLTMANLNETNFMNANLTGCHIFGISVWNVNLEGAVQKDLVITEDGADQAQMSAFATRFLI